MNNTISVTLNNSRQKIVLTLFSLFLFAHNAFATTGINVGPPVGKKTPAISAVNTQEQAVNIKQLSKDKGLILLFFRSADWCPFCKKHLIELNNQAEQFTELGYGLAAISYDNTAILTAFAEQQMISYPLLSDQNAQTMLAYNILNKTYVLGDANYGIPYPGVVVIDNHGNVLHKHFFKGYKKRVKFTDLYLQLKSGS
jgi:peroxiredoxin